MLTTYFDESYNHRTMCIGGWLCRDDVWALIEKRWLTRMKYESRRSEKKGLKPVSRYHAADCASRVGEFAGWTKDRQILLTKKLLSILGYAKPAGFAAGLSFAELTAAFPQLNKKDVKWEAYKLCMQECIAQIGLLMEEQFPHERVNIIHDRGDFNSAALSAFDDMHTAVNFPLKQYFVGIQSGSWEDFVALQPADLIAFEGFKLTDAHKRGQFEFRRSMETIMGNGIPIRCGYFRADGLRDLAVRGMGLSKLGFVS